MTLEERIKQEVDTIPPPKNRRMPWELLRPLYYGMLFSVGERILTLLKEDSRNCSLPWDKSMDSFLQLPYRQAREEFRRHYIERSLSMHPSQRRAAKNSGVSRGAVEAILQRTTIPITPCPSEKYLNQPYHAALEAFTSGYLCLKLEEHQGNFTRTAAAIGITRWHLKKTLQKRKDDSEPYKVDNIPSGKTGDGFGSSYLAPDLRENYKPIILEELLAFRRMLSRPAGDYLWRQRKLLAGKVLDAVFGAKNARQE